MAVDLELTTQKFTLHYSYHMNKKISIKTSTSTPSTPKTYTGDDLLDEKAPIGFYRNVDKTYSGIVLVTKCGSCTYFDINSNMVYAFDRITWKNSKFVLIPDMKKIEVTIS